MPRKTRGVGEIKKSFIKTLFKTEIFEEQGDLKELTLQELEEALGDVETLKTDLRAMSRFLMEEIRQKIREEGKKMKNIKIKRDGSSSRH